MGRAVLERLKEAPALRASGAWARGDVAGLPVEATADLDAALAGADVAVEFTLPEALERVLDAATAAGVPLVSGTTGLGDEHRAALSAASREIAIVRDRNMSAGVHVLASLARRAASLLGEDYDVEILELHHRHKRDAPSGTALSLGEAVAAARGGTLDALADLPRHGADEPRGRGRIGFASLRGGDAAGEHTVLFAGEAERLELTHRAGSRALFAAGALRAAAWLVGRAPGLYGMRDVLGIVGDDSDD